MCSHRTRVNSSPLPEGNIFWNTKCSWPGFLLTGADKCVDELQPRLNASVGEKTGSVATTTSSLIAVAGVHTGIHTKYFQIFLEATILGFYSKSPNFLTIVPRLKKTQVDAFCYTSLFYIFLRHLQVNLVLCFCGDNGCCPILRDLRLQSPNPVQRPSSVWEKIFNSATFLIRKVFPYLASKNDANPSQVQVSALIWPLCWSHWNTSF